MTDITTLADALPAEMARVRDEVMPACQMIGPPSILALTMMRADLDLAAAAMMSGDLVTMLRVYQSLKEWHV